MRALVLGGCGFIGTHLVETLVRAGDTVRVLDLGAGTEFRPRHAGAEYVYGDWLEDGCLARALAGPVECVYHLIGTVDVAGANADPTGDLRQTVHGSLRLLERCVAGGAGRVVFVSSGGAVYGVPRATPIREDHPTAPLSAHGVSKLAVEKYLAHFGELHGLRYQIARCANPYGEGQDPRRAQGAVAVFAYKALRDELIDVWGDGGVVRDYVYVGDVAAALRALGGYDGPSGVFNVGSGVGRSLVEVLDAVGQAVGHAPRVRYAPARPYDVPANVLDIGAIRARVGWAPKVDFGEGVRRTAAWLATFRPA